ncbi:MAG TPA: LPS export ABC transporter periplasmic protein LptC [Novimethylophilus sp.]|jgi:lipopolysaccharide export system protein LptC|uniref:LPS export ABC transporter periplasmic protein LptC n=1 Tax=Novimethylophilus sp. TaxID=2137426 RepID=UPI002F3EBD42
MKGFPAIWFALILLALLAALTLWIDHSVQPPAAKRDGSTRHDPDYIVNNFSSHRTDRQGNPRYSLAGTDMRHFPDDDTTKLTRPFFTQFSLKKPTIQVQGGRGLVSPNAENVYFMDNVRMVRAATPQKGELTLLTEYMHIMPDLGLLKTDRPVTILQAPRTVVHASGMEYNKKERILKLFNRVKVHYERPDAPPLPPLTVEQVAGVKAPVTAPAGQKQDKADVKSPRSKNKAGTNDMNTQKTKTNGRKAKKTETKAGHSKTRIRRHYANPAN